MPRRSKYPRELMDRGVRLALESGRPVAQVARDLGVGHDALRKRVRQAYVRGASAKAMRASRVADDRVAIPQRLDRLVAVASV